MGLGNTLKALAKRAESLFSGENNASPDPNLLDNLDRSWSGRARDGPLHYHGPLYRSGPSREGSVNRSVRLSYNSAARDSSIRSGVSNVSSSSNLRRVSSEPCIITGIAPGSGPKQDSASSFHGTAEPTAPLNIGDGPTLFQLPPMVRPSRNAQHNNATGAAALTTHLIQASAPTDSLQAGADSFSPQGIPSNVLANPPRRPVAPKQGGLSCALSREASVRQGQHGRAAVEGAQAGALANGRWDKQNVTCVNIMSDSAHRSDGSQDDADSGGGAAGTNNDDGGSTQLNAKELAAALASIQTNTVHGISPQKQEEHNGVIVIDTSLAMDWSDTTSGAAAANTTHKQGTCAGSDASIFPLQTPLESNASDSVANASSEPVGSMNSDCPGSNGNKDWNSKFIQRWKAVKQRARLQALGVRTIWKFSSPPNGEHHPPELLVNDVQGDLQQRHGSLPAAQGPGGGRDAHSNHGMGLRDPSLATMLLEEVA